MPLWRNPVKKKHFTKMWDQIKKKGKCKFSMMEITTEEELPGK